VPTRETGKGHLIKLHDPEYADAKKIFSPRSLKDDINGYYPDDAKAKLPYTVDPTTGFFIPDEPVMRMPRPEFFFMTGRGKHVLHFENARHFSIRCASCGMKGHSASHPNCPLQGDKSEMDWNPCAKCGTGLHSNCKIDPRSIVPFLRSTGGRT
jgi:hypothetical protein